MIVHPTRLSSHDQSMNGADAVSALAALVDSFALASLAGSGVMCCALFGIDCVAAAVQSGLDCNGALGPRPVDDCACSIDLIPGSDRVSWSMA